jgi:hypothetical protein
MSQHNSHGLQVAVIVFATLTVMMSSTAFWQFKQAEEARLHAAEAERQAAVTEASVRSGQREAEQLRQMMGYGMHEPLSVVRSGFEHDLRGISAHLPQPRSYRLAIQHLSASLQVAQRERIGERERLQELQAALARLEADKEATVFAFKTAVDIARTALAAELKRSNALDSRHVAQRQEQSDELVRQREIISRLEIEMTEANRQWAARSRNLQNRLEQATGELTRLRAQDADLPDGEIRFVSAENRAVWINLGSADGLRRQVSFSVYAPQGKGLRSPAKGKIEVTRVLTGRLSEARIVEEQADDPILQGDKIETPLWQPGQPERFALCGDLDIDHDGISDSRLVRALITLAGGVIDAELSADGATSGEMTAETRWLVLGNVDTDAAGQMQRQAAELGVQAIQLTRLLERAGWHQPTRRAAAPATPRAFRGRDAYSRL